MPGWGERAPRTVGPVPKRPGPWEYVQILRPLASPSEKGGQMHSQAEVTYVPPNAPEILLVCDSAGP